jgi:hypothetical protein
MPVSKQDAQGVGSAITYGRRYGLMAMCGVPADDDDGHAATSAPPPAKSTITPTTGAWEAITEKDRSLLTDLSNVVKEYVADGDFEGAMKCIDDAGLDADHKVALWTRFDSKARSAMKRAKQEMAIKAGMALQA